jgi:hypothetical protein
MVKWPLEKAQRGVARGGEGEKAVGPVVDGQHAFFKKSTHDGKDGWCGKSDGWRCRAARTPGQRTVAESTGLAHRNAWRGGFVAAGQTIGLTRYCPANAGKRVQFEALS